MKRWIAGRWRRALRLLGPLGVAAVLCLIGALAIAAWIPGGIARNAALRQQVTELAARPQAPSPVRVQREPPLREQLVQFMDSFPPLSQNPQDLRRVFDSAALHQVLLPKGEYLFKNEANAPLMTVTMSLPLKADYAATKAFSAEVLEALPNASLDELRMTRGAAGDEQLESLVRFSFVYRKH